MIVFKEKIVKFNGSLYSSWHKHEEGAVFAPQTLAQRGSDEVAFELPDF